jgi:hypothetical protein
MIELHGRAARPADAYDAMLTEAAMVAAAMRGRVDDPRDAAVQRVMRVNAAKQWCSHVSGLNETWGCRLSMPNFAGHLS